MTLDDILSTYLGSSASDWHHAHAPLAPGTDAYEGHYVYKPDIALVVGPTPSDQAYSWEWVEIYPDKSAGRFWIDLLYNGVPVYREIAVHVDGSRADLPSPAGYVDADDPTSGWHVPRDEYAFVRQYSVIRGQEANFDQYYAQARDRAKLTLG